jgi:hypothetical protein
VRVASHRRLSTDAQDLADLGPGEAVATALEDEARLEVVQDGPEPHDRSQGELVPVEREARDGPSQGILDGAAARLKTSPTDRSER